MGDTVVIQFANLRFLRRALVLLFMGLIVGCDGRPKIAPPVFAVGSAQPHLSTTDHREAVLSWLEPHADGVALRYARFDGQHWTRPATVASGEHWFVNWADFPSVSAINGELWAAHWLAKKPGGTYSYDIRASLSHDGGLSWERPFVVHNDDTPTEHGFASLFPWAGGIGVLWLDGRHTGGSGHGAHGSDDGGMTLRSARFDTNSEATHRIEMDALVCDCCQTDVAMTDQGPVAVYRDRTEGDSRDIAIARSIDGQWQPGIPVAEDGWEIDGCPVNGPAADAHGGRVAVAWFTGANDQPTVKAALSDSHGRDFSLPVVVDDVAPIGRVDTVLLTDGSFVVSWLAKAPGGEARILAQRFSAAGAESDAITIAKTAVSRRSGFPQMVRMGNGSLLFAWTAISGDSTQVNTRLIETSELH